MKKLLAALVLSTSVSALAVMPEPTLRQRLKAWEIEHGYTTTTYRWATAPDGSLDYVHMDGVDSTTAVAQIEGLTAEQVWTLIPPAHEVIVDGYATNGVYDGSTHRLLVIGGEQVSVTNSASPQRAMSVQIEEAIQDWISARSDRAAVTYAARNMVKADALTTNEMQELVALFPAWKVGVTYKAGDVVQYGGKVWECIQGHASQSDWTPSAVASLWKARSPSDAVILPWVQPTGAHDAYAIGAIVTYNGQTWRSTAAANVYAPGVFGWEEVK